MKIPFGLHKETNRFMGIDEVKNGLQCGCICPECKMRLKARHGEENEHHFAHHDAAEVECNYSYWVSIRSMAKQIIIEEELQVDYHKLETFVAVPWEKTSQINIMSKKINPKIKEYQFDVEIEASFGKYYIHLLTDVEDIGRTRKHASSQFRKNTFTPYLVLEIDLKEVKKQKNKDARNTLENLIMANTNQKWFSSKASYVITKKVIKPIRVQAYKKETNEIHYSNFYDTELPRVREDNETEKLVKRMIGFYQHMKESYSFKDKLSSDSLSVIYRGKNLWYVSFCNEFFCVSYQDNTFIVYSVIGYAIKRLTSCYYWNDLEISLSSYIVDRDQVL